MSVLDKKLQPAELPIFRFKTPGDRIHGRYLKRRVVETRKYAEAHILDVDVIESRIIDDDDGEVPGSLGWMSIFESHHITQLFDSHPLQAGDEFILQFCSMDSKSRFKRFALEQLTGSRDPTVPANGNSDHLDGSDDIPF